LAVGVACLFACLLAPALAGVCVGWWQAPRETAAAIAINRNRCVCARNHSKKQKAKYVAWK
jgi:hypothetical protein